ncbi:MAG TPA: hypothetical protein VGX00_05440 [Thermoplasmata archaeon]|nr:hypothetical protein [Thermoplasmata archaeon]
MTLEDLLLPIVVSGGVASAIGFVAWKLLTRYYVPVPPNRALILYGRRSSAPGAGRAVGAGAVELRAPRILVGGGAYVPPWRTGAGYLSLEPLDVDTTVRVRSTGSEVLAPGWEAVISAQVKIPAEPSMLRAAAENLLGKSRAEIGRLVSRAVEGAAPPLLVRLTGGQEGADWERLAAEIQASVARDLVVDGLTVRSVALKELRRLPEVGGPIEGEDGPSMPHVDLLAGDPDAAAHLVDAEPRTDRLDRPPSRWARAHVAPAGLRGFLPARPEFLPHDPSGGTPPAPSSRGPVLGNHGNGGGRWRTPLDAK